MIKEFKGRYFFLSNFYEKEITYNGITYLNNEAAFQAQKVLNESVRAEFSNLSPKEAKRKGRRVTLRPDWEEVKDDIMYEICLTKFLGDHVLLDLLHRTSPKWLIEGNYWHDNYWGDCSCEKCKDIDGKNKLGKILMDIRSKY